MMFHMMSLKCPLNRRFYLENYAKAGQIGADGKLEGGKKGGLFYDVQNLSRIWNHPYILVLSKVSAVVIPPFLSQTSKKSCHKYDFCTFV